MSKRRRPIGRAPQAPQTPPVVEQGTNPPTVEESPATPQAAQPVEPKERRLVSGAMLGGEVAILERLIDSRLAKFTPEPRVPLVFSAISNVMADLEPIAKTHINQDGGFTFRMIDELCTALQPLFVKHKLISVPEVQERWFREAVVRGPAGSYALYYTTVKVRWRLYCALDGSQFPDPCITLGEGVSDQGFSVGAAQTFSFKQMLWQVFCIPVLGGDDPEANNFERSTTVEKVYFKEPTSVAPAIEQPALFEDLEPSIVDESPTRGKKRAEVAEFLDVPPPVKDEPISKGMIQIIGSNLKAAGKTESDLFAHFTVQGFDWIMKSQMGDVMAFIHAKPQET